jgi:hypothetical protein
VEHARVRARVEDARLYLGTLLLPRARPRPNWIRATIRNQRKRLCVFFSNRIEFEFSERERERDEEAPELADRQRGEEIAPQFSGVRAGARLKKKRPAGTRTFCE